MERKAGHNRTEVIIICKEVLRDAWIERITWVYENADIVDVHSSSIVATKTGWEVRITFTHRQ